MYNIGIGNLIHATVTSTIMQISIQRPEMYQLVTLTKKAIIISRPNKMFLIGFFSKEVFDSETTLGVPNLETEMSIRDNFWSCGLFCPIFR